MVSRVLKRYRNDETIAETDAASLHSTQSDGMKLLQHCKENFRKTFIAENVYDDEIPIEEFIERVKNPICYSLYYYR